MGGAYKSEDKGRHWRFINGGGLYRSGDGGATWRDIKGNLPYVKPIDLRFNPAIDELWAGGVGLFRTPRATAPRASSGP